MDRDSEAVRNVSFTRYKENVHKICQGGIIGQFAYGCGGRGISIYDGAALKGTETLMEALKEAPR